MKAINKILTSFLLLSVFCLFSILLVPSARAKTETCPCTCAYPYPPDTPDSEVGSKDKTFYIQTDSGCSSDQFRKSCEEQCNAYFSGSGDFTSTSKFKILDCEPKTVTMPDGKSATIQNDCDLNDFTRTLYSISKLILGITGSLALLMFVYGGFTWLISSGNREMVQKGKNILIAAVIGIVIVFAAYSAIEFTVRMLTGQNSGNLSVFQGSTSEKNWQP